ncbi:hypothetical protein D3C72_1841960 [compost metagenome]
MSSSSTMRGRSNGAVLISGRLQLFVALVFFSHLATGMFRELPVSRPWQQKTLTHRQDDQVIGFFQPETNTALAPTLIFPDLHGRIIRMFD